MKDYMFEAIWLIVFLVLLTLSHNYQSEQYRRYNLYANECVAQGGVIMNTEKNFTKESYQCYLLPKEEK